MKVRRKRDQECNGQEKLTKIIYRPLLKEIGTGLVIKDFIPELKAFRTIITF
jgi:hypothetical protein